MLINQILSIHIIFFGRAKQGVAQSGSASALGAESYRFKSCHLESKSESTKKMKINRPLSPHLTIYKPQLTSTFSIFHRISGAFLAAMVLFSIFFFKIGDLSLTFYHFYQYLFFLTFYLNWVIISLVNFTLLALCYHMSNGVRHLLWDSGLFLELSKVYTSGIIMLLCAAFSALLNIIRQHWSNGQIPYWIRQRKRKYSEGIIISTGRNGRIPH